MFYKINCKSHKIEEMLNNKKIVMFGAGVISKYYVERYNINVEYYVDNNPQRWNTEYLNKKIVNPNFLLEDKENIIVFIGSQYINEISQQLEEMNFKQGVNYFIPTYLEEEAMEEKSGIYENNDESIKRLLIDMTEVAEKDKGTGIERVVKNIVKAAYTEEKYTTIAVQRIGNLLYEPSNWLEKNEIRKNYTQYEFNKIKFTKNDTLLILDAIWNQYDRYKNVIKNIKGVGGNIISVIYDVIPLEHPEKCLDFVVNDYKEMLLSILENGDGIIAISKVVADKLISYINRESIFVKKNFKIGWFHMGIAKNEFLANIKNQDIKTIMNKKPYIIVGTIEPRKDHKTVLEAFELLWKNNIDVKLCIIGKIGWNVEKLVYKIKNHNEYNIRLFLIENPSDSELGYCYENAEALIFSSIDEGFGLPIIEAASYKLPLILSNIPIFKEIANENAIFFECKNAQNLAESIIKYNELKKDNLIPESGKIKINTWHESFNDMVKIIYENKWYKQY